jgi:MFS family permease
MPPSQPAVHDSYAAFRHSNYRLYAVGNFITVVGQQMLRVAVGFEVYRQTHSVWNLGLIGLAIWLPIFFLTIPGGLVADRYSRKWIVLACQLLYALCSLGLALASFLASPLWVLYGLLFLTGVSKAFEDTAKQSLLPQLVPKKIFTNALTWNSSIFQVATVSGPALGGFLIISIGYAHICLLESLFEMVFFGFVLALKTSPAVFKREPVSLASLLSGLKFVRDNHLILATITMDLFVVILGGATALLPAFSIDILHCGAIGYGFLQAATPLGAFLMALLLAHRPPMKKAGTSLLWAVAGFGVATIIFGLSQWYWLSFAMLFMTGALDNISVIVRSTLVQVLTPDSMRGRVTAVSFIFIHSSNELGGFESGAVASIPFLGPVGSVVLGGIGSVLVVLAVTRIWPEVARFGSLEKAGR